MIAIVDYGMGNLRSVQKALEQAGAQAQVKAGAAFIQTQAVFDLDAFKVWLEAAKAAGLTERTAILAGVLPLKSAAQAQELLDTHTDFIIPEAIIKRLTDAGSEEAQGEGPGRGPAPCTAHRTANVCGADGTASR